MRTLVCCQTHIFTEDIGKLFTLWLNLREALDDEHDWLVIDSASPRPYKLEGWADDIILHDDEVPLIRGRRHLMRFPNALGHPFHQGVLQASGSDRAFCKTLEIAHASGYDRIAVIEMDVVFTHSVASIFERMTKPCACGPLVEHGRFPEMGLFFANLEYLWKTDFIKRYDWRGKCDPEGELRAWQILGDDLELLQLRGARDGGWTSPGQLAERYPDGIDYLTHAHMETYAAMLKMNNMEELAHLL